ncbi:hypothetical protein [Haloarcula salina]|uniref:Ig-like domain-containing protein n=1 Tax=Haloarcula salina TaxID=1429914 RepID=A0AA41FY10_9EURY|nr:hypothetical protein [Haloarcula salina]MBV0900660.1 hypothetical protein [Haloarcula salina]
MRRRQVLAALAALPAAGCVAPGSDRSTPSDSSSTAADRGSPTPHDQSSPPPADQPATTPPLTANPDDPILFVIHNTTDSERTVHLRVARGETAVLDETATLAPDASREYDSGIATTGEYSISVDVENGPSQRLDVHIGEFAVRSGSNHYVEVTPDGVDVSWEE